MTLLRFLVTAAHGDVAEAIHGVLREMIPGAVVIGCDASAEGPGTAVFERLLSVPLASAPDYVGALTDIVQTNAIDLVIPVNEREIERLAADAKSSHLPILMVAPHLVSMFVDKLATARWLQGNSLAAPWTVPLDAADAGRLPFIVKPRRGAGSASVQLVKHLQHLAGLQAAFGDQWVAQEFLPDAGAEFTCALLRVRGECRTLTLQRKLDAGRTVMARVVDVPEIREYVERIAAIANLDGAINVQLRMTPEGPKAFEINPRFSSTVRMRHKLGFQDLMWAVSARAGQSPPVFVPRPGVTVYRLSREVVDMTSAAPLGAKHT